MADEKPPPMPVTVAADTASMYEQMRTAAAAATAWTKEYDRLKAALLGAAGYGDDDPKPPSRMALSPDGLPLFTVEVSYRKGFDRKGLEAAHPAIFAQFETKTPVKSIKPPQS